MYVFTQRLFPVPYEWGRLLRVVLTVAALVAVAELLIPTSGAAGLLLRIVLFAAYPLLLLGTGFFTDAERDLLSRLRQPGAAIAGLASLRAQSPAAGGEVPEIYEVEQLDEDLRS